MSLTLSRFYSSDSGGERVARLYVRGTAAACERIRSLMVGFQRHATEVVRCSEDVIELLCRNGGEVMREMKNAAGGAFIEISRPPPHIGGRGGGLRQAVVSESVRIMDTTTSVVGDVGNVDEGGGIAGAAGPSLSAGERLVEVVLRAEPEQLPGLRAAVDALSAAKVEMEVRKPLPGWAGGLVGGSVGANYGVLSFYILSRAN